MVSILAETVYDETVTGFDPANGRFDQAFDNLVMPTESVSPPLSGFAYVETVTVGVTFFGDLDLTNNDPPRFSDYAVFIDTDYIFNNNLDLFGDINRKKVIDSFIQDNGETLTDLSGSTTYTVDKYVDVPADIQPTISTTQEDDFVDVSSSTGTLDVEITVSFIGRTP